MWVDNENVECIHNELLLGHEKECEIGTFAGKWMELETIKQNERSQTQTCIVCFLSYRACI